MINAQLVHNVTAQTVKNGGNPARKQRLALHMLREMHAQGHGFDTIADAFAIFAAWNGHSVTIDGTPWIPSPLAIDEREAPL